MSNIYGRLRVCYCRLHGSNESRIRCAFLQNQQFIVHFHSEDYDELNYQIRQPIKLQSALKVRLMSEDHLVLQETQLQLTEFFKQSFSQYLTPLIRLQFGCRLSFQLGCLTFKKPQTHSFFVQVQLPNKLYYSKCLKTLSNLISFQQRTAFETSQRQFPITLRLFRVQDEEGTLVQEQTVWVKEVRRYVKETVGMDGINISFFILNSQDDNCFSL